MFCVKKASDSILNFTCCKKSDNPDENLINFLKKALVLRF
jgi:hypothetical protein